MSYIISFNNIPSVEYIEDSKLYYKFIIPKKLLPDIELYRKDDIIINNKKYIITKADYQRGSLVLTCIIEDSLKQVY